MPNIYKILKTLLLQKTIKMSTFVYQKVLFQTKTGGCYTFFLTPTAIHICCYIYNVLMWPLKNKTTRKQVTIRLPHSKKFNEVGQYVVALGLFSTVADTNWCMKENSSINLHIHIFPSLIQKSPVWGQKLMHIKENWFLYWAITM